MSLPLTPLHLSCKIVLLHLISSTSRREDWMKSEKWSCSSSCRRKLISTTSRLPPKVTWENSNCKECHLHSMLDSKCILWWWIRILLRQWNACIFCCIFSLPFFDSFLSLASILPLEYIREWNAFNEMYSILSWRETTEGKDGFISSWRDFIMTSSCRRTGLPQTQLKEHTEEGNTLHLISCLVCCMNRHDMPHDLLLVMMFFPVFHHEKMKDQMLNNMKRRGCAKRDFHFHLKNPNSTTKCRDYKNLETLQDVAQEDDDPLIALSFQALIRSQRDRMLCLRQSWWRHDEGKREVKRLLPKEEKKVSLILILINDVRKRKKGRLLHREQHKSKEKNSGRQQ